MLNTYYVMSIALSTLQVFGFVQSSQLPYDVGAIITPIIQIRKQRFRKTPGDNGQSRGVSPGSLAGGCTLTGCAEPRL